MRDTWVGFDQASDRAVILAAWKANKISGEQAWELFTNHELWGDREEAFHRYAVGSEAMNIQRELWGLSRHARAAAKRLIMLARHHEFMSLKAADWLLDLFAAKVE